MKLLAVTCVAVVLLAGRSVVAQEEDVGSQVRLADMWKIVEVPSKLDRTSSSAGEREGARSNVAHDNYTEASSIAQDVLEELNRRRKEQRR